MLTVEQALQKIDENVLRGPVAKLPLQKALGLALAADVISPINMPPFAQSAMDGFAFKFNGGTVFTLIGELKAGDAENPTLKPGDAVRIFTGAAVPATADAVARQEDCELAKGIVTISPLPKQNANIRPVGEQIKNGETALEKGHVLNAASVGFLAGLGISEVAVFSRPKVAILITGNELALAGQPLKYGQIYESNSAMLAAGLQNFGFAEVEIASVKDDYKSTKKQLERLLQNCDVLLCSGGISVGDYDFVGKALPEIGAKEIFYKVLQQPGKPLYFGKKDQKLIFALPGNPAAALTCFYVYVLKALFMLMGKNPAGLPRTRKKLTAEYARKGGRAQFLKAAICGDEVAILDGQSSAMLHTFAQSNALVYVPLEVEKIEKGVEVECILWT